MPAKTIEKARSTRVKNRKKGNLFIISAPSGAGKTTLCNALLERFPDVQYSISHTTRPPRNGEQNGKDYYFISVEEFKKNIDQNIWAEWAEVHDHFYGTSAKFIDTALSNGNDILLDIDVQGAKQILVRYPESITIFIMPPSMKELELRLKKRGSDSSETISKRLMAAEKEIAQKDFYAHVIINDVLPESVKQLSDILCRYRQQ